jgi:hypothetical protein
MYSDVLLLTKKLTFGVNPKTKLFWIFDQSWSDGISIINHQPGKVIRKYQSSRNTLPLDLLYGNYELPINLLFIRVLNKALKNPVRKIEKKAWIFRKNFE